MIEDALQEGYAKGLDEGLAKGVIKGREEGRAEGRADAAKRMIASGMTKEQVAAILELSTKEINTLLAF
jgi:predicted transposase/invertase (TIGR01784 family)